MMLIVIIPNYNYAAYVGEAVQSVLAQTYRNIEIIVVNNGSIDNSLEVLNGFGDKIILVNQSNRGQSGARNAGLTKSTGGLIAFLDADDLWEPTKLEKQIALMSDDIQLIYSGLSRFDDKSGETLSLEFPRYKGNCTPHFLGNPGISVVLGGESSALFSRELLSKVGSFDSNLSISAGWDFFRRCSYFTNFDFVPEVLIKYRIHANNMSSVPENYILDIRNAFYKMVSDSSTSSGFVRLFSGFIELEWSFVKTFILHRSLIGLIGEFLRFPYQVVRLFRNYQQRGDS